MNFQINQLPEMRIIGKVVYPNMDMKENLIPEFGDKCFEDGTFTKLEGLKEYHIDSSYVGWMSDWEIYVYLRYDYETKHSRTRRIYP
ncbi:hypothetical protein EDD65_10184 [Keratinibaculum paraultunense]|uniref:Uncharacterized protein n=1 Tax=Keratinibaculum paraultunense TaxID=1278232 RepID=A0A4R3L1K5_9FIRM|nr:hypothetical protein [Keratinibaculum paraultunense]TCS91583.1 hypothetical protein EDD65_10184 [Keratinibaculum paraultunense]